MNTARSKLLLSLALLLWYGFFMIHPIDLLPADLGRFIKNGEIIVSHWTDENTLNAILHTNFYAETARDTPFLNHHWASGIIYYALHQFGGFPLLTIFSWLIGGTAIILMFLEAARKSRLAIAAPVVFFLVPLFADRTEIRPEAFSYLFIATFFILLARYKDKIISFKTLLITLPLLEILWVNLHIYFFWGPVLVGLFWLDEATLKHKNIKTLKQLSILLLLVVIGGCANPSGIAGFLYPLHIFSNYGYAVQENMSLPTLMAANSKYGNPWIFLVSFLAFLIVLATAHVKKHPLPRIFILLEFLTAILAWRFARNQAAFALLSIPILSYFILQTLPARVRPWTLWCATFVLIIFFNRFRLPLILHNHGLGLVPKTTEAANFINEHNIAGPMFNDFDIGGYAIYYMYPRVRPFVDNRPEAYGAGFFQKEYIPMQTDEAVWRQKEREHRFNMILYSFEDETPWAMPFIIKRLQDPAWAPVFVNQYTIVFVKRNEQNVALIKQYEIPKEKFSVETK